MFSNWTFVDSIFFSVQWNWEQKFTIFLVHVLWIWTAVMIAYLINVYIYICMYTPYTNSGKSHLQETNGNLIETWVSQIYLLWENVHVLLLENQFVVWLNDISILTTSICMSFIITEMINELVHPGLFSRIFLYFYVELFFFSHCIYECDR